MPSSFDVTSLASLDTSALPRIGRAVGRGSAHAKLILFGEHVVVYGKPAVALPLRAMRMRATAWREGTEPRFESDHYTGPLATAPEIVEAPRKAIEETLRAIGGDLEGLTVAVRGNIPLGRGLGSSAAAAGAIVDAVSRLHNVTLSGGEHFALVQLAEQVAHGKPSGLDALATTIPSPIRFQNASAVPVPVALDACFVIADTGVHGSTRQAVDDVRTSLERDNDSTMATIDALGELSDSAIADLETNEPRSLGARMSQAHELLSKLGVSHPALDGLVAAATGAGAFGAKLTGGGLGGCIVAVVERGNASAVASALQSAGAIQTWSVTSTGTPL